MPRFSLIPRQVKFFDLFERSAANLVTASLELAELLEKYDHVQERVRRIISPPPSLN